MPSLGTAQCVGPASQVQFTPLQKMTFCQQKCKQTLGPSSLKPQGSLWRCCSSTAQCPGFLPRKLPEVLEPVVSGWLTGSLCCFQLCLPGPAVPQIQKDGCRIARSVRAFPSPPLPSPPCSRHCWEPAVPYSSARLPLPRAAQSQRHSAPLPPPWGHCSPGWASVCIADVAQARAPGPIPFSPA